MMVETSVFNQQQFLNELLYQSTTNIDQQYRQPAESEDELFDDDSLIVPQHLTEEQYQFQFPPRHRLRELAYLDTLEDEFSFFDPCSFSAAYPPASSAAWHEDTIDKEDAEDEDDLLVDDSRLSPLQLPARVIRKATCPTNADRLAVQRPVGPASFLHQDDHMYTKKVVRRKRSQQNDMRLDLNNIVEEEPEEENAYDSLRVYCNESVPIMDPDFDSSTDSSSSVRTAESRVVFVKLNKRMKLPQPLHTLQPLQQQPLITYIVNDEGYADGDLDNEEDELESNCVFYPLSAEEEALDTLSITQHQAATKIQAAWRGYCDRRRNQRLFASFNASQRAILNLAGLCGRIHHRQMVSVNGRLSQLEQQLTEETAMRNAFEKAMEDMTELIDQQQKTLYDRLHREEQARHNYEEKLTHALSQIDALEARLKKETSARNRLEDMMTRVLDQMHETETLRREQAIEDAETKKKMQAKIDQLTEAMKAASPSNTATKAMIKKQPIIDKKASPIATARASSSSKTSNITTIATATLSGNAVHTTNTVQKSIIPASTTIHSSNTSNHKINANSNINSTRRITRTQPTVKNTHTPSSTNHNASSTTSRKSNITALPSTRKFTNNIKRSKEAPVASVPAQQPQQRATIISNKRTLVPRR